MYQTWSKQISKSHFSWNEIFEKLHCRAKLKGEKTLLYVLIYLIWFNIFGTILYYLTQFQINVTLFDTISNIFDTICTISHFRFQVLIKISPRDSTPNIPKSQRVIVHVVEGSHQLSLFGPARAQKDKIWHFVFIFFSKHDHKWSKTS